MTVTIYAFEDAAGNEFGTFTTQDYAEAKEYASVNNLRVLPGSSSTPTPHTWTTSPVTARRPKTRRPTTMAMPTDPNDPEMTLIASPPKFKLGQVVGTPGALAALEKTGERPGVFLARHIQCDWGDCDTDDKRANDFDLANEGRLFSVYHLSDGTKIWVITEADRSSTCVLLPEEY